ncbi:endonuclease/Exonuclease/phosphatase family protein [Hirsutella rhossiliensis]|uniref:DNA-(apurinic or apyrimidinic site) endonuclease 2 n=1 Tax=Hirsutella rhossiliensis TaxID=111463 RepID=A0A9P8N008_9HYPO|nr:endonuclease/Exonuclease/phosphatase family domain-containing protein [Hirsutella rhossiliensis]KAH0964365.1 endonuclease/Exonuclease/phosphatase family domain-containing protein [Hirsutella rhossiliensis]
MGLRITTWNVNGIRNPFGYQPWREQRTFQAMFEILEADIVVMQETKIQRKDLQDDMVLVPGWDVYFSLPRHKKGYSGVAIYTRNSTCAPTRAEEGVTGVLCTPRSSTKFRELPEDQQIGGYPRPGQLSGSVDELELDSEGRCVILEFPAFVLFGVYSPANRNEARDDFRLGFLEALDVRIRNVVAAGKQVVLTGDLNVTRSELDTTNLLDVLRKEGIPLDDWMSMPSRRIFNQLLFEGTVSGPRDAGRETPVLWDLCRCFHPHREGMNTCWDTKRNTRPANNGSRIDYVLCSDGLKSWFMDANIQEGLMGSDHCPVYATMVDRVEVDHGQVALADLMNPSGMFQDGKRVREWSQKDVLPLSAKLIPEFDRRQSIRDMFSKKPEPNAPAQPPLRLETWSKTEDYPASQRISSSFPGSSESTKLTTSASDEFPVADFPVAIRNAPAQSPQQPSQLKRSSKPTNGSSRSAKRVKPGADPNGSKAKANSGQKTLQGFFKPAMSNSVSAEKKNKKLGPQDAPASSGSSTPSMSSKPDPQDSVLSKASPSKDAGQSAESPERVFDPIQAKESWSKLLGKRLLPRCEHDEPCISLVTKKPGVNCGRSFYICPRPLGPSGEKEKGSEWRCGTFIWSSDWNCSSV